MKNKLIIIGEGEWLDIAYDAAARLDRWSKIDLLVLERTGPYSYDIERKLGEVEKNTEYFLALDGGHFGTIRESILSYIMQKGFSVTAIMSERHVGLFKMKVNSLIHPLAIISEKNKNWGFNVLIGPNVYIGPNVNISRAITIGNRSEIHSGVGLGKNVSLGKDVNVCEGVVVKDFSSFVCRNPIEVNSILVNKSTYSSDLFVRPVIFHSN
jgi:hypothetical protein